MNPSLRLAVTDLAVSRGERLLFQHLTFTINDGEVMAVTGPNGIGKTSLLRAIAGFLRPDHGTIALEGIGDDSPAAHAMHFLGYRDGLKAALTVRENLALAPDMLGSAGVSLDEAADRLDLVRLLSIQVGALSSGQRRRAALARLLMVERRLWLLDEPTSALDAASTLKVAEIMEAYARKGGIIIAATHLPLGIPARELAFQNSGGFALMAAP